MVVLAVSCALVALVAFAVVDADAADAAEGAAVVADVAPVKVSGLLKKSPCGAAGTFLYCIRHKGQIAVHRIKVKYCAESST
ncbi:hypothetical protein M3699_08095 [Peribacillus simplex]|uniref:hypothetical protein n=1 Tax=Peribacillus simplex TaxID=1478 RepID=UPI00203F983A|nr:hypothetical protein [Peribacillus simplex]MCM3673844.1 hypothetical protein [Peribacillus simplex]